MELQVDTKDLTKKLNDYNTRSGAFEHTKDYVLIASLVGIMERLERLHGAILSLQKNT